MADITVTIPVTDVQYTAWLRTSYLGLSVASEGGTPMIEQMEFGKDQEDALANFLDEATREVLKVFISRQGDVTGLPFEFDGTTAIYRFNEEEPVLPQAAAIKSALNEDVKNALYTYATYLWMRTKDEAKITAYLFDRYLELTNTINKHLYKLHD